MAADLPEWYLEESRPRLARLDELSGHCAWEKSGGLAPEESRARAEWRRLMGAQVAAEVAAGL